MLQTVARNQVAAFPDRPRVLDAGDGDDGPAAVVLTVEIEYLHHTKPHHRDSDERRAHKASVSTAARAHEGKFEYEYARPIELWTAEDISFVIDMVRERMPRVEPDGMGLCLCPRSRQSGQLAELGVGKWPRTIRSVATAGRSSAPTLAEVRTVAK